MTVRERLLALKYLEKQKRYPELADRLGISVQLTEKTIGSGDENV